MQQPTDKLCDSHVLHLMTCTLRSLRTYLFLCIASTAAWTINTSGTFLNSSPLCTPAWWPSLTRSTLMEVGQRFSRCRVPMLSCEHTDYQSVSVFDWMTRFFSMRHICGERSGSTHPYVLLHLLIAHFLIVIFLY